MAIRKPINEPCMAKGCTASRRSRAGLYCRRHEDQLRRRGTLDADAESVRTGAHTPAHTAPPARATPTAPAEHRATVTALPSGRRTRREQLAASVRPMVRSDGKRGGFDLPEGVLPKGEDWHSRTRAWWDSWRRSPQAARMLSDPDWDYLLDTALLHHAMWTNGRWDFAAEVRQRVAAFGATPADRVRLRFEIEVPEQYPAGDAATTVGVSRIDAARDRWASGSTVTPGRVDLDADHH